LKQQAAHLLVVFFNTMTNHKTTVEVSYEDIQDRVFKLKEREKNIITDRLKGLTPEERDADTILKVNKLGVWSKGLQKGLTSYVAETYDDERELRENFDRLEKKLLRTNDDVNDQNRDMLLADLIDQEDMDNEAEQEAYDMRGATDDYGDGNFEGDEVDNYGDYD
jgi:transcriptional regulator of heat shock response